MSVTLPRRAFLGAELPGDHEAFTADGARIAGVAPDSMAERAGLAAGDLLVSLASLPVRNLCELAAALRRAGGERKTELVHVRDGERRAASVDVVALPQEPGTIYGELAVDGAVLRTLATEPANARALVLLVQGIACESIDTPESPIAQAAAAFTRAGFATLRFDKRGIGDSTGGPCSHTDFATELADARAVLALAQLPVIVFGHSVGGIIATQLPASASIVYGTPVMRWIECLVDSTRRQLALHGAPASEIDAAIAQLRALATTGELNGRSAAYHAQLDALDLEAAWRAVTAPVLVVRGEHDWVVDAADQARIADLARDATICDVPGVDHLLGAHADRAASLRDYGAGAFDERVVDTCVAWLHRLRSRA